MAGRGSRWERGKEGVGREGAEGTAQGKTCSSGAAGLHSLGCWPFVQIRAGDTAKLFLSYFLLFRQSVSLVAIYNSFQI